MNEAERITGRSYKKLVENNGETLSLQIDGSSEKIEFCERAEELMLCRYNVVQSLITRYAIT